MSNLQNWSISMCVLMDIGLVQISCKMNLQICVDENGAHWIAENIEFPHQPCTPDFRKMEFSKMLV